MIATPCSLSLRMWPNSSSTSRSVIAAVGSSMMMTLALTEIALMISISWHCATVRFLSSSIGETCRPHSAISLFDSSISAFLSTSPFLRISRPTKIFSYTGMSRIGFSSWWIIATPMSMASLGFEGL